MTVTGSSSSTSNSGRTTVLQGGQEVIHIGIGDWACMMSTHLHHIQGVSCTTAAANSSSRTNDEPYSEYHPTTNTFYCQSAPTHYVYQNQYVPRSLLIGNIGRSATSSFSSSNTTTTTATTTPTTTTQSPPWTNNCPIGTNQDFSSSSSSSSNRINNRSYNNDNYGPYSRFYTTSTTSAAKHQRQSYASYNSTRRNNNNNNYNNNNSNNTDRRRHVNWEEEDMNEQEEEQEEDRDRQNEDEQRTRRKWENDHQVRLNAMDDYWNDYYSNSTTTTTTNSNNNNKSVTHLANATTTLWKNDGMETSASSHIVPQQQQQQPPVQPGKLCWTWYDYLDATMPYHPTNTCIDMNQSPLVQQQQQQQQRLDDTAAANPYVTYYNAVQNDTHYIEDVIWEHHIRTLLEQCDSCQGLLLLQDHNTNNDRNSSSSSGMYTGWGTKLLQVWNDECPHTVQCSIPISSSSSSSSSSFTPSTTSTTSDSNHNRIQSQQRARNTVRDQIQESLVLSDQTSLSTVVLPIQLPNTGSFTSVAAATAAVAMALECSTLPYRLINGPHNNNNNHKSQLVVQSSYYQSTGSGTGSSGTTNIPHLSYREFVRTLQRQSTSRNVLELDTLLPWNTIGGNSSSGHTTTTATNSSLFSLLQRGTSIERDERMKRSGYQGGIHRPTDVLPGEWMNNSTESSSSNGILSSLSPQPSPSATTIANHSSQQTKHNMYDRNLHYHYAISTSIRPPKHNGSNQQQRSTTSNYVKCIMESMGVRYRPEQSMCTVLDQSYEDLLLTNGSYWKYIFRGGSNNTSPNTSLVANGSLSVLGNTTRIYPYLAQTASNSQQILLPRNKKSTNRSLYNQDVTMGNLPEIDDCNEAITTCLDIRDSYEPPQGSGLIVDEEGEYFDT